MKEKVNIFIIIENNSELPMILQTIKPFNVTSKKITTKVIRLHPKLATSINASNRIIFINKKSRAYLLSLINWKNIKYKMFHNVCIFFFTNMLHSANKQ